MFGIESVWCGLKFESKCPCCDRVVKVGMNDTIAIRIDGPIFRCPLCSGQFRVETHEEFVAEEWE